MISFALTLVFKYLLVIGLAVALWFWKGETAGWLTACLGLAFLYFINIHQLFRLERWLKKPEIDDLPDAWGVWGKVFSGIYAALRQEIKKSNKGIKDLELFILAAQAMPNGVTMLDSSDQLIWYNDKAREHLGLKDQGDHGLRITNLVRVPRLAVFLQRHNPQETLDYRPIHNPNQYLSLNVIPFADGRKLLVSYDVTSIERADTMRRDFIANVSHELRTPLTVIHGYIEHMYDDKAQDQGTKLNPWRRPIHLMMTQSNRMLKLVDDLLMLSRLESGDHPAREEWVGMPSLLSILLDDAKALSQDRHTIEMELPQQAGMTGAMDELSSAFGNLISNAVRYTPAGGKILISWMQNEHGCGVFKVQDTGIGIAAEHIPRLTERFYRVDRGRSRETGGTGLGLAIIKHVVMRHQATLKIESTLGEGSIFSIEFPYWRTDHQKQNPLLVA